MYAHVCACWSPWCVQVGLAKTLRVLGKTAEGETMLRHALEEAIKVRTHTHTRARARARAPRYEAKVWDTHTHKHT